MQTFVNKTSDTEGYISSSYSTAPNATLTTSLSIYLNGTVSTTNNKHQKKNTLERNINNLENATYTLALGPPNYMSRHFNWADLTLEFYSTNSCDEL